MVYTLCALFVLAVAAGTTANVVQQQARRHREDMDRHHHHLSLVTGFGCHHPQPRAIPVTDLLTPYQTRGKAYFPELTVLHRCEGAGCCDRVTNKCKPVYSETVKLPFKVTYLEDMANKAKGNWELENYYFDNHTVCGCDDHHGHDLQGVIEPKDHTATQQWPNPATQQWSNPASQQWSNAPNQVDSYGHQIANQDPYHQSTQG